MEGYQIIAGFSDLKTEFTSKTKTSKSTLKLKFWFTLENGIFFMHDYDNHKSCIVLAIFNERDHAWTYYVRKNTYGEKLIDHLTSTQKIEKIAEETLKLYTSHGFFTSGVL